MGRGLEHHASPHGLPAVRGCQADAVPGGGRHLADEREPALRKPEPDLRRSQAGQRPKLGRRRIGIGRDAKPVGLSGLLKPPLPPQGIAQPAGRVGLQLRDRQRLAVDPFRAVIPLLERE